MYIKKEINIIDSNYLLRGIPNDMYDSLIKHDAFLAGGSLLSSAFDIGVIHDYDFYFKTEEDFNAVSETLKKSENYALIAGTKNALTYSAYLKDRTTIPIQLIQVVFGEPEEVLNTFDISVCKIGFNLKDKILFYDSRIPENIKEKTMKLDHFIRPAASVFRVCKYINKGLKPDYMDMLKLSITLSATSVEDIEAEYGNKGYFSPYRDTMEQAYKAFPDILKSTAYGNLVSMDGNKDSLNKIMEKILSVAV